MAAREEDRAASYVGTVLAPVGYCLLHYYLRHAQKTTLGYGELG